MPAARSSPGQGLKTALPKVAAEALKAPMSVAEIVIADSGRSPNEGCAAAGHSRLGLPRRRRPDARPAPRRGRPAPGPDGKRLGYGDLVGDRVLHGAANLTLADPSDLTPMNHPVALPDLHARLIRPPCLGARIASLDRAPVEAMAGLARAGAFPAVAAEREWTAAKAKARSRTSRSGTRSLPSRTGRRRPAA